MLKAVSLMRWTKKWGAGQVTPAEPRTPAKFTFRQKEETRLDTRPTTEQHGSLDWDQQLAAPEVKSGITLPRKVSELRKNLSRTAE
jgi:hypothetical protein